MKEAARWRIADRGANHSSCVESAGFGWSVITRRPVLGAVVVHDLGIAKVGLAPTGWKMLVSSRLNGMPAVLVLALAPSLSVR